MEAIILKAFIWGEWEDGETIKKDSLLYCFLNTEGIQNFQEEINISCEKSEYNAILFLNSKKKIYVHPVILASESKTKQKWNNWKTKKYPKHI